MKYVGLLVLVMVLGCAQPIAPIIPSQGQLTFRNACDSSNAVAVVDTLGTGDASGMLWMTPTSGIPANTSARPVQLVPNRYYTIYVAFPAIPRELAVIAPAVDETLLATCSDVLPT